MKVSIIIPCHNYEAYVRRAIMSAIDQTYPVDIHVIEDVSTDGTKAVIEKMVTEFPHKFTAHFNKENKGMIRSVNDTIELVDSEVICKLDADDMILTTMVEDMLPTLEGADTGIAYSIFALFGYQNGIFPVRQYDLNYLRFNNFIPSCNLFKKEAWEDAGKYDEDFSIGFDDWNLWISMAEKGGYGRLYPEMRYLYRRHEESMDTRAKTKYADVCKLLIAKHPSYYEGISVQQLYNAGGYPGEIDE